MSIIIEELSYLNMKMHYNGNSTLAVTGAFDNQLSTHAYRALWKFVQ